MHNHKIILLAAFGLAACTTTVQLQATEKPIEINLKINIEQHVKVEIQKDVEQAIAKRKDIF